MKRILMFCVAVGALAFVAKAVNNPPCNPPYITSQPLSRTNLLGSTASFSVSATGSATLTFQWRENGISLTNGGNVSGAISPTLTLTNVAITNATYYDVVIANGCGYTNSSAATLTILTPPVITTQPQNQMAIAEQNVVFGVVADGPVPLGYQWFFNATNAISGATNITLVLLGIQTNNAGNYTVVITNVAGSATSMVASLTVLLPPVSWLQYYFGTNWQTNPNAAINADPDGDGLSNFREYQLGTDPTDYYNGVLPTLAITAGNNQNSPMNALLPQPLTVQVTRAGGIPLTNAPLTFSILSGSGGLASVSNAFYATMSRYSLRTDTNGNAMAWFIPSSATNQVVVTAQSGTNTAQVIFTNYANSITNPVTITPNGGSYVVMQNVTVSCATPGVVFHYTLNGNNPIESDPVAVNGNILVMQTTTLKVRAYLDGVLLPGAVQSANFTILGGGIAAGYYSTYALKFDGSVWAAGTNGDDELGQYQYSAYQTSFVPVMDINAGWPNYYMTNAVAVDGGGHHGLALMRDGTVKAWGQNSNGQLGNTNPAYGMALTVTNLNSVIGISAGGSNNLALISDGTVRAWGSNNHGQLGDNTTTDRYTNVVVTNLNSVVTIAAGGMHSLALLSNGTVRGWGFNSNGQLGDNTTTDRHTNVVVTNLTSVAAISAGGLHNLALLSNGTVRAWGYNSNGQLGDNTTTDRHTNVAVTGISNVVAIAAGGLHSLALLSNGVVCAWGSNSKGQLGDGTTTDRHTNVIVKGLSNVVAIAAGYAHSVALKSDGTVVVWGYTNYGLPGGFSSTPVIPQPTNHLNYWTPPLIVTQPQNQMVALGLTATFSVTTVGTAPMSYQWYSNSVAVANATNAILALNNIQTNSSGVFWVVVSNTVGVSTSSGANLSVLSPPMIVIQPVDTTALPTGGAVFNVVATGSSPLSYYWQFSGRSLYDNGYSTFGSYTTNLILVNVTSSMLGGYSVVVSNSCGTVSSRVANLAFASPPSIITQPTNQTVVTGNSAWLNVIAVGTAPLSYQWYFNTNAITGATNSTLLLTNVQPSAAGSYTVSVTNSLGSITSSVAMLNVSAAVSIPPPLGLVDWWRAEGNALDSVGGANGTLWGNLTYVPGKVGQAFHFPGTYGSITFGTSVGNFGTNDFTVEFWARTTVYQYAEYPLIAKLGTCGSGSGLSLCLEGQGFNNPNLPGTLVAEFAGTDASDTNHIVVESGRTINDGSFHLVALVRQTTNVSIYIDGVLDTNGTVGGITCISNAANLVAGSSSCVGTDGVSSCFAGDLDEIAIFNRALSSDEIHAIYSASTLGLLPSACPPFIFTQPTSQTIMEGDSATFSVVAAGSLPLSYQWLLNGTNINGATQPVLSITNVSAASAGTYSVVVTNRFGSIVSSGAILAVAPLTIDIDFNNSPYAGGLSAKMGFAATGVSGNDFWNFFSCYPSGSGLINNLLAVDGTVTAASVIATNIPDYFDNYPPPADPMYAMGVGAGIFSVVSTNIFTVTNGSGIYYFTNYARTNIYLTGSISVSNLVPGTWDIYLYSPNGEFDVSAGATDYGIQTTYDGAETYNETPLWQLGVQYAVFPNVTISTGQVMNVQLLPPGNNQDAANLCGMQLVKHVACANPLAPIILLQPQGVVVSEGSSTVFRVVAAGTLPLTYQWNLNGTNIVGATNAWYVIHSVRLDQAGAYTVQVSNIAGTTTSANANLSISGGIIVTFVGSPTFRSIVLDRMASLFNAGYQCISNGMNYVTYQGTISSNPYLRTTPVNISFAFVTNSTAAIGWLGNSYDKVLTAAISGAYTNSVPDLALSDIFPADTGNYQNSIFGVIPYVLICNNALAGVTNFSRTQGPNLIYGTGDIYDQGQLLYPGMPASYLGANNTNTVYLIGYYDSDLLVIVRSCLGDSDSNPNDPVLWTVNNAGQFIPSQTTDSRGYEVNLTSGPAPGGIVEGYTNALAFLAAPDYQLLGTNVAAVAYNGVPYSSTNVINGSYALWGYGQIVNSAGLSAGKQAVRDALINAITNAVYASSPLFGTNGLIPLINMRADRSGDGQLIAPHNF